MELMLNAFSGVAMLTVVGFSIKTYVDVNNKIERNYTRMDEVKGNTEATFVRKDMCKILHEQTADDVAEIKSDIKEIKNILSKR
jgi:hypothetical protein